MVSFVSFVAFADAGPIPAELANIPQLTDLDLAENRVEGMHMHTYRSVDARYDNDNAHSSQFIRPTMSLLDLFLLADLALVNTGS